MYIVLPGANSVCYKPDEQKELNKPAIKLSHGTIIGCE